jgi:hypothetical protein
VEEGEVVPFLAHDPVGFWQGPGAVSGVEEGGVGSHRRRNARRPCCGGQQGRTCDGFRGRRGGANGYRELRNSASWRCSMERRRR